MLPPDWFSPLRQSVLIPKADTIGAVLIMSDEPETPAEQQLRIDWMLLNSYRDTSPLATRAATCNTMKQPREARTMFPGSGSQAASFV